jgi:hypothetical protein
MRSELLLASILFIVLAGTAKADPVILDTRASHYVNGSGNSSDFLVTSLTLHPDIVAQQIFGPNDPRGYITLESQLIGPAGTLLHGEFFYDGQLIGVFEYPLPTDSAGIWFSLVGPSWPLSYVARPAVLNLNFGGTTASYAFTVREPVPEPSSLLLTATGLIALLIRVKWSRGQKAFLWRSTN